MNCSKCILAIFYCTCNPAGLQMNSVCIQCKDFALYKKWQNLFLQLLITPKTYGYAHLRHTSALVHWPILHNIILLQCTCIFVHALYTPEGDSCQNKKLSPFLTLGIALGSSSNLLIMKVVMDYAVGWISPHYILSEALDSFWQLCCI